MNIVGGCLRRLAGTVGLRAYSTELAQPRPDKLYGKVELEMRANDPAVLRSYAWFVTTASSHLGATVDKSWPLRKSTKTRFTVLKSVHVHKKHRVQYEYRTYYHFVHLVKVTESTGTTLLEYLERNLPEGVAMKVTKCEMMKLPDYLVPPQETTT